MNSFKRGLTVTSAMLAIGFSMQANATLILNTGGFNPTPNTTDTDFNDLPGVADTLYFGQLQSTAAGSVDFFYVGNEAGYTNTLRLNGSNAYGTSGLPDEFNSPDSYINSIAVGANQFVNFGFCTSGGDTINGSRCAYNSSAASLWSQWNNTGYRSIGFNSLSSYNPGTGLGWLGAGISPLYSGDSASNYWAIFWDDSGAANDDNHDDMIVVARFRPTSVPEPSTLLLMGLGMLGVAVARRRARK